MFFLSTAHLVLLASSLLRHIRAGIINEGLESRDSHYPESYLQLLLECLNVSTQSFWMEYALPTQVPSVYFRGLDYRLESVGPVGSKEVRHYSPRRTFVGYAR